MVNLISGVDRSKESYILEMKAVRNTYELHDMDGNEILSSKWRAIEDAGVLDP